MENRPSKRILILGGGFAGVTGCCASSRSMFLVVLPLELLIVRDCPHNVENAGPEARQDLTDLEITEVVDDKRILLLQARRHRVNKAHRAGGPQSVRVPAISLAAIPKARPSRDQHQPDDLLRVSDRVG